MSDTLALLEPLITIVGIAITALMVIWQIRRQFDHSLRLQARQAKESLKIEIYNQLRDDITDAVIAEVEANMYVRMLGTSIIGYWGVKTQGFEPGYIKERAPEFATKKSKLREKITKLIVTLERYDVVAPRLRIFGLALNSAMHDIDKTFLGLFQRLVVRLPMDLPPKKTGADVVTVWPNPITEEEMSRDIQPLIDTYVEACSILGNFLFDLGVEAQMQLLGALFEEKPRRRKPLDPKYVVVTSNPDDLERLENYFHNETEWGRAQREAETYARARFIGVPD